MTVLKTKNGHINFLKSFLILLFIGVYFFSVTPVHTYAHAFIKNSEKTEKSKTKHNPAKQNNCTYYKYVSNGLGNTLVGDIQFVEENKEYQEHQSFLQEAYVIFFKDHILDSKSLRAPPFTA